MINSLGIPNLNMSIQELKSATFRDRVIANRTLNHGFGSFGCIVKNTFDDQKFILSCFHVMQGDFDWTSSGPNQTIINADLESVSTEFLGFRIDNLDIALATIDDETANFYIRHFGRPGKERPVTEDDIFTTEVSIHGAVSQESGIIVHDSSQQTFTYRVSQNQTEKFELNDLIAISSITAAGFRSITKRGDSGSLVKDKETGNALGIVVGRDLIHTYAMKITTIFSKLDLELA